MFTDTYYRRRFMQMGFGSLGGLALNHLGARGEAQPSSSEGALGNLVLYVRRGESRG